MRLEKDLTNYTLPVELTDQHRSRRKREMQKPKKEKSKYKGFTRSISLDQRFVQQARSKTNYQEDATFLSNKSKIQYLESILYGKKEKRGTVPATIQASPVITPKTTCERKNKSTWDLKAYLKPRQDAGHFEWNPGQLIGKHNQYEITALLGDGTFGRVLEARDTNDGKIYAIKVIRAVRRYKASAKIEAKIIQMLNEDDPDN